MHWGQIKTLLILSFFILDIYLLSQFLDKKELSDIAIWEEQSSSIEDQLKSESITIDQLPEADYEESFISVKQHIFEEKELSEYKDNVDQQLYILNNYLIISALEEEVKIKDDDSKDKIEEKLNEIVYEPDKYSFWNWNRELNIIIFFQNKNERPVYYNQNGLIMLFLNDKNEVEYYSQTMLGETEALAEKQKLIKPKQAIETLFDSNELHSGDHIDNVKIGFHTRVPFDSGVQVFAPIWKVNVNDEQSYFVNAIEGFTFSTEEQEFLLGAIDNNIDRLQVAKENKSPLTEIVEDLKERQKQLHDGGVEK